MNIPLVKMSLPQSTLDEAKRLLGFDYGDGFYHVLAFDFGDDGGAIGVWREGDNFCARITLDALAEFNARAKESTSAGTDSTGAKVSDTPILDALIRLQDSRKETWHVPPEYIDDLAGEVAILRAERDGLQIARDVANSLARQYMNQVGNLRAEVERKQAALEQWLVAADNVRSKKTAFMTAEWSNSDAEELALKLANRQLADALDAARRAVLPVGGER